MNGNGNKIDLSVIIPAKNEQNTIAQVVRDVQSICSRIGINSEVLVVIESAEDNTGGEAAAAGAVVILQSSPGYGGALIEGFSRAEGAWILTMDADLSHPPIFIEKLWEIRSECDTVIASRWAPGGHADMPLHRYILSRLLNRIFSFILDIPISDLSSGFRLYRKTSLNSIRFEGINFDILQSILSGLLAANYRIIEAPFDYRPRIDGQSNARIIEFGIDYLKALFKLSRKHSLPPKN